MLLQGTCFLSHIQNRSVITKEKTFELLIEYRFGF